MFTDQSILVTGGTGSFGMAFIRAVLSREHPRRVIVFSRDELKQFEMSQLPEFAGSRMRYFIGDVRDRTRLVQAMQGVDYVVHAAALKQVSAAEYNPMECINTNIHGAENVIAAAIECNVAKVIGLSTDKAANPINLYGASKLASDKLFVAANNMVGSRDIRFSVVRYGNVVDSRGSVIPLFRKLLAQGATQLPITDERMTRFWITLEQGVEFVLQSFRRMQGGELFMPKIPSSRIVDIVEALKPGTAIRVVGVRPGEKLHEVMCPRDESHLAIEFDDHYVLRPTISFVRQVRYDTNALAETGRPTAQGFEYNSGDNPHFLQVPELRQLIGGMAA